MRPLRLDLAGFTVFREPTTVDFTDADFFALVGPTGSGKSTILDAICFALYGTVPRWGDLRAIGNALAPSAVEARVRLVFESGGRRYVLTRVVRRDGKGKVATKGAAMEALPTGFDLSRFDSGLSTEDIGEVVAGTPSEVDAAVLDVVGLPYEQFTKCVVLPQGEFAAFLHAKPADRQRILVNLLGLDVYGRIRDRASALGAAAEAQVSATDQLLAGLTDADDDALAAATRRLETLRTLVADVDAVLPELTRAGQAAAEARSVLAALDAEIARLAEVRTPEGVRTAAASTTNARAALASATNAVSEAEEREEKLRGDLAGAGDPAELGRWREAHREHDRTAAEVGALTGKVDAAEVAHARCVAALDQARGRAESAHTALEEAREAYQAALTADRAAALRPHLRVGEDCPVCVQRVTRLPDAAHAPAITAAEADGRRARDAAEAADREVTRLDREVHDLDRTLVAARTQVAHHTERLAELAVSLAGAPGPDAIERELAGLATLQRGLDEATTALRIAREAHRRAAADAERASERLRVVWRQFDTVRDAVASFGPPAADRDDLAVAWSGLADWALSEVDERRSRWEAAASRATDADRAAEAVHDRIRALFAAASLDLPANDGGHAAADGGAGPDGKAVDGGGDPARVAAVELERADAALRRVEERRADAARMRERRAIHERESLVAKALVNHLRANNFERWLLEEALDSLVDGASQILRELSAGQYELGHDKGEFYVLDHHDAALRRAVRTLSGGETFQASLALALALSEQLAGMSTSAASLESIVLDEGFGTLDPATLDTVAATLENLAARGDRMVGVVTHVGALAERIPVRFEVHKDARSAYVERVG